MRRDIDVLILHGFLTLFDKESNRSLWQLDAKELGMTRNVYGHLMSNWILHLNTKSWITTDALYRVAKIITERLPGTGINWAATFFVVEKKDYLETLHSLRNEFEGKTEADFMDRLALGIQENTDEINVPILKIVAEKLKAYKIE